MPLLYHYYAIKSITITNRKKIYRFRIKSGMTERQKIGRLATTNGNDKRRRIGGLEDWKIRKAYSLKLRAYSLWFVVGGWWFVVYSLAIKGFTDFNSAVAVGCNQRVSKFLLRIKHLPTAVYITESEANGT